MVDTTLIRVWRFYDAPEEFRALSPHGGDEDWIAVVPDSLGDYYIPWLDHSVFGNSLSEHKIDGYTVKIAAHA